MAGIALPPEARELLESDAVATVATIDQDGRPQLKAAWVGLERASLQQVLAAEDGRVVGLYHDSGERNGKRLDTDCCIVFDVKDGRITGGREVFSDLYAWDGFWA